MLKGGVLSVKQKAYAEIEKRFSCPHVNKEIRHRIIKGGRPTYVSQCVCCGHTSTPVKAAEALRGGKAIPEYDYQRQENWRKAKNLAYEAARIEIKLALRVEYEAYLESEEWLTLRIKVLERCNYICEVCEDAEAGQVHHLTYERIGKEEMADLLGVCKPCHELIHGK